MKCECQNCGREFELNRMWQKFCCKRCQQKWNKDRYRAEAVEAELEARLNGHEQSATPEQRQKAKEVLARIVEGHRSGRRMLRRI
jgi:hypothetical protein